MLLVSWREWEAGERERETDMLHSIKVIEQVLLILREATTESLFEWGNNSCKEFQASCYQS